MEYWATVYGVLGNSLWSTGQQFMEYWATVYGVLGNSLWSTGQQFMEYWATVYGVLGNILLPIHTVENFLVSKDDEFNVQDARSEFLDYICQR